CGCFSCLHLLSFDFFIFLSCISTFVLLFFLFFFFFNDTATTEIYTLSLHDALPISPVRPVEPCRCSWRETDRSSLSASSATDPLDRKSTRLNSSHRTISYAVFCLKKKKKKKKKKTKKKKHKTTI